MSRALLHPLLQLKAPVVSRLASALALSVVQQRAFNTSAPIIEPPPKQRHEKNAANPTDSQVRPLAFKKSHPARPPRPVENSVEKLLPLLVAQPGHYITVHIHGFPYLVQEGDQVRLPFRIPGVLPGDVLRLDRASVIGSRDYTMKGAPHIDPELFQCRATVLGTESEPLRIKLKTKRRQRKVKRVKSKHRYTILRISELRVQKSGKATGHHIESVAKETTAPQRPAA
ncbi:ribosomal prokaryotic l21 protein [Hirsutella rhossiliensis]